MSEHGVRCKTCGNRIRETVPENVRFVTVQADKWETVTCSGCGQTFATAPKKRPAGQKGLGDE